MICGHVALGVQRGAAVLVICAQTCPGQGGDLWHLGARGCVPVKVACILLCARGPHGLQLCKGLGCLGERSLVGGRGTPSSASPACGLAAEGPAWPSTAWSSPVPSSWWSSAGPQTLNPEPWTLTPKPHGAEGLG